MRAALHVFATLVLLPYVALATSFAILGHAISSGSLLGFFNALLAHAVWLVPWGLMAIACAIGLLAVGGMIPRFQRVAGLCLAVLAGASLAVIVLVSPWRVDASQTAFLLPCFLVFVFGAWAALVKPDPAGDGRPSGAARPLR